MDEKVTELLVDDIRKADSVLLPENEIDIEDSDESVAPSSKSQVLEKTIPDDLTNRVSKEVEEFVLWKENQNLPFPSTLPTDPKDAFAALKIAHSVYDEHGSKEGKEPNPILNLEKIAHGQYDLNCMQFGFRRLVNHFGKGLGTKPPSTKEKRAQFHQVVPKRLPTRRSTRNKGASDKSALAIPQRKNATVAKKHMVTKKVKKTESSSSPKKKKARKECTVLKEIPPPPAR